MMELPKLTDQVKAQIQEEHGSDPRLKVLEIPLYAREGQEDDTATVVVKIPSDLQYKAFKAEATKAETTEKAMRALPVLVRNCLVWPTKEEWKAMGDEFPGLPDTVGQELLKLTGAAGQVRSKNL